MMQEKTYRKSRAAIMVAFYILAALWVKPVFADASTDSTLRIKEEDGSPSKTPHTLKVTNGTLTDNLDGTVSLAIGVGAGDVESVGDCASGACFTGTSGSTLTFNDTVDATMDYDGTGFVFDRATGFNLKLGLDGTDSSINLSSTDNGIFKWKGMGSGDTYFVNYSSVGNSLMEGFTSAAGAGSIATLRSTATDGYVYHELIADTSIFYMGTDGAGAFDHVLYFAAGAGFDTMMTLTDSGTTGDLLVTGNITASTAFLPDANDGAALGTTALQFSDLFMAEGGVINWDNGDATLTQTGNILALAGASLSVSDIVTASGALTITPAAGSNLNVALSTTGDFAVNTNQLYFDTSTERIGVRTSSPSEILHLHAPANSTGFLLTSAVDANLNLRFYGIGNDAYVTNGAYAMTLGGDGYMTIKGYRVDLKNGMLFVGDDVSVGHTSPNARLDVIKTTEQFRVGYDTSNYYSTTVGSTGIVTFNAVGSASSFVFSDNITANAKIIFDGTTTSSGAGAVGITGSIHEITTTGTGNALTLADGVEGQRLTIVYVAEGAGTDTAVLTPSNFGSGTTVTFSIIGQSARLIFTNAKWYADGAPFGAVIA